MPEFAPGVEKTAVVPMSNPTTKAFDYTAELYMGVNLALMTSTNFHLEAGESKDIDMPVVMPSEPGTYPVYIGVFSGGQFIEPLYQATEDVRIAAPALVLNFTNPRRADTVAWDARVYAEDIGWLVAPVTALGAVPGDGNRPRQLYMGCHSCQLGRRLCSQSTDVDQQE